MALDGKPLPLAPVPSMPAPRRRQAPPAGPRPTGLSHAERRRIARHAGRRRTPAVPRAAPGAAAGAVTSPWIAWPATRAS